MKQWRGLTLSPWSSISLGAKEDPYSFSRVYLEDLRNGDLEYLATIKQLVGALPKTLDPASRFALRGHVTPSGHERLRHSMRAALWWLLPSDGEFCRAPHALHYHLAHQGRRVVLRGSDVTQPLYESRVNWIHDPAPPTPHRPAMESADAPSSAILKESPGAPSTQPKHKKSRRRRRRKAARTANHNSASRRAAPMTPDERWANDNSASRSATRPSSAANDPPEMRSTTVYQHPSFHSSRVSQLPIPATNENAGSSFRLDHPEFSGLYKPAQTDPRQDLTATHSRVNSSGFGLSSPAPKQPYTKPFSGLPSGLKVTSPYREAGGTFGGRPGIVYPLLPRATRPDTKLVIDAAALPESAALSRQSRPPTVLDLEETREKENQPPSQSRRQPRKRRRNRSTGVYRPSKRSPPRGRWCD